MSILSIILFIVSLCVLVTIHELGHFSMAKLFGVYCREFSIGFGPKIFSHRRKNGETYFSIRAVPLGGYVSMYGEGVEEVDEELAAVPKERSLLGIKKWKRAIIMVAGIFLNFVLGFLLFAGNRVFFIQPFATQQITVVADSLIAQAGVETGDYIISISKTITIDGTTLEKDETKNITKENLWKDGFTYPDGAKPKTTADKTEWVITYRQTLDGENQVASFTSTAKETTQSNLFGLVKKKVITWDKIGVSAFNEYHRLSFAQGMKQAGKDWVESCTLIGKTLGGLFIGQNWDQIGGPISILTSSSEVLSNGFGQYLYLWGLISVNLAIFNLLPFPGLDGWHFVVIIFEGITRKEMPEKAKNIISAIGMLLLFALMIFVSLRDIWRL